MKDIVYVEGYPDIEQFIRLMRILATSSDERLLKVKEPLYASYRDALTGRKMGMEDKDGKTLSHAEVAKV